MPSNSSDVCSGLIVYRFDSSPPTDYFSIAVILALMIAAYNTASLSLLILTGSDYSVLQIRYIAGSGENETDALKM